MKLDEDAKKAVNELGDSINRAIGENVRVTEAIENLRAIGYEPHLTLKLEIALAALDEIEETGGAADIVMTGGDAGDETDGDADGAPEITDEDLRILQKMNIRF